MKGSSIRDHYAHKPDCPDTSRESVDDTYMVVGLNPVISPESRILILGSFPSVISLRAGEYYANPRNQFWKIMSSIVGFSPMESYQVRTAALLKHGIGLWDIYQSCIRKGSLDTMIQSPVHTDLEGVIQTLPAIRVVVLNGRKAEQGWIHWTKTVPSARCPSVRAIYLPSTSPANTLPFVEKQKRWEVLIRGLLSEMPK